MNIKASQEYRAVQEFYGTRWADRSGVPLIEHINQGLRILDDLGADFVTKKAYCLHPLFQNDNELKTVGHRYLALGIVSPYPIMLVMEYRCWANRWLSDKVAKANADGFLYIDGEPSWGTLPEVRLMLIADKVQNRKDFLIHHLGIHDRSTELVIYFLTWMKVLSIDENEFNRLIKVMHLE